MWRAKENTVQIFWCSALTRKTMFAQYKYHNTAFTAAVCSFNKSFCYRIKIRRNVRAQMPAIGGVFLYPLLVRGFFALVLSCIWIYLTVRTILTLSFLSQPFPSEPNQASIYGPLSESEAADAAAGSAVPPPSSSSSSSSPLSSSTPAFCPASVSSRQIVERQPRMLNFRVEYRQRSVELVMEESSTVGELVSRYVQTKPAYPSVDLLHTSHLQKESNKSLRQNSGFQYPKCSWKDGNLVTYLIV